MNEWTVWNWFYTHFSSIAFGRLNRRPLSPLQSVYASPGMTKSAVWFNMVFYVTEAYVNKASLFCRLKNAAHFSHCVSRMFELYNVCLFVCVWMLSNYNVEHNFTVSTLLYCTRQQWSTFDEIAQLHKLSSFSSRQHELAVQRYERNKLSVSSACSARARLFGLLGSAQRLYTAIIFICTALEQSENQWANLRVRTIMAAQ